MEEKTNTLKVRMLGGFQIFWQGEELQIGQKQTTKAMRMLQVLLHAGPAGISREQLLEDLFGYDAEGDIANNLSVTVHSLRKLLKGSRLPEENYIYTKGGRYWFSSSFPLEVDALIFQELIGKAKGRPQEERLEMLKRACRTYGGHFLPALIGEEWATVAGAYYQNLYTECMEAPCRLMTERKEHEELCGLCCRAAAIYPFDEWQIWQMECLFALKRFKEARELYEKTQELYMDELDAGPTRRLTDFFQKMSSEFQMESQDLEGIQMQLSENDKAPGAYYCPYPSFVDTYRTMVRVMERSGQSVYLMLCMILDERKKMRDNSDCLKEISEKLSKSI